jgi:hypothetical protein
MNPRTKLVGIYSIKIRPFWLLANYFELPPSPNFPHGARAVKFPFRKSSGALRLGEKDIVLNLEDVYAF